MPPADNTRFLIEATKKRSQQARLRAEEAIKTSARRPDRVTAVEIARAASVSRSWLYTQADLITAISQLQRRPAMTHQTDHALQATRPYSAGWKP